MQQLLTSLIILSCLGLHCSSAQEIQLNARNKSHNSSLQDAKPEAVPQAQWDKFTASISFTCEQWGAEIGFLTPFLFEKEIIALVRKIAGPTTTEVFVGYKSRPDHSGCKMNDRFVCVIKECDALNAR